MRKKIKVLILGLGGNVSQGILKSLKLSNLDLNIVGSCISPYSAGIYETETCYISPYASDPIFFEWLCELCIDEKIDVVMTGVEEILYILSEKKNEFEKKTNSIAIVSDFENFKMALNKYETCKWLEENELNFPDYVLNKDKTGISRLLDKYNYNLIAKPIYGKGSTGIIIIKNKYDLEKVINLDDYVIQELIGSNNEEFTVGCYCDRNGVTLQPIVMKRELQNGTTSKIEIGEFENVRNEAIKITNKLLPKGPCNIQMRLKNGVPCCFEINLRFSGTTPIRAYYGYNDSELSIKDFLLKENDICLPLIKEGISLRYWNEIFISPTAVEKLNVDKKLLNVSKYKG